MLLMNEKYPTSCKRKCTLRRWKLQGKISFKVHTDEEVKKLILKELDSGPKYCIDISEGLNLDYWQVVRCTAQLKVEGEIEGAELSVASLKEVKGP
jgi:hypothetical protein